MKILGPVRTGVQSLALEQSGVEAELAKGAAIAQATGAIGAMVSDYEERKARDFTIEQNNIFSQAFAEEDAKLKLESKNGDEYAQGMKTFFERQKLSALDSASGNRQKYLAETMYEGFKSKYAQSITETTAVMNRNYSEGLISDLVNSEINNVYNNPNQLKQSGDVIAAAIRTADIPEVRKAELIRSAKSEMRYMQLVSIANNNPVEAMNLLKSEDYTKNMPPQKILTLSNYASQKQSQQEQEFLAMSARADKQALKIEKAREESTAKDLFELDATGQLTIDDVVMNRDNLSESNYKYFIGQASGVSANPVTNVNTYSRLYAQTSENPEQAKADALQALKSKELTIGDFNKINTLADKELAGDLPTPYKQAASYLSRVSRTNELNPPVGAGERYANASDDFNQWFEKNPDVDAVEATTKAREIWAQYQLVESPIIVTGIMPYGVDKSRNKLELVDLKKSANALSKARADGVISDEEFKKQQQILVDWKKYLESKQ